MPAMYDGEAHCRSLCGMMDLSQGFMRYVCSSGDGDSTLKLDVEAPLPLL